MTHSCARKETPRSLCEEYQYTTIYIAYVEPNPTFTSPLLPCPHILILLGMCCQVTVSVNTAPGKSDRKPPQLSGNVDAITECTPICSDNWLSVHQLFLCQSPLFCFYCKTAPVLELCIFPTTAVIYQTQNKRPNLSWFMNSQHQLPFLLIIMSGPSPINSKPRKCHS